jgi:hypothetical protein
MNALLKIGREGNFAQIPSLCKVYKSHRRSELIRLGLAADAQVRRRGARGSIARASLKTPEGTRSRPAMPRLTSLEVTFLKFCLL